LIVLATVLGLALALAATALGATVTVRVEGKTQPIFGSVPVKVQASNALVALDAASTLGEFYFGLTTSSFGTYVSQIGRYPAAGSAGWVFKVNGASPPVGADQVKLKDGDRVLWYFAQFGIAGGPSTLDLRPTAPGCYRAVAQDDQGAEKVPPGLVFHIGTAKTVPAPAGRICPKKPHGLVWATAPGSVRSNRLP
jgi:hypothetical protein